MQRIDGGDARRACCGGGGHRDDFTLPGAAPHYAPDLALEPTHIEVRLRFDLDRQRAEGAVTTTLRANRGDTRRLRLDAMRLEDLSVVPQPGLAWSYDGRHLDLTWAEPLAEGEEHRVEVRYVVASPITGMHFCAPDAEYPDRATFVATDHETERARYWLPCVDYPTVRTTFDFHLTAPRDLTILANGELVGEEQHKDGTKTAHWRLAKPCPSYLCCFAVGRFVRCDDGEVGGRPLAYFAPAGYTPEDLKRTFGPTPAMMRWLEERLGRPFPFPKYFQVALTGIGGAMENISLVTFDEIFLCDETLREEWGNQVDQVNIHEMAHSYFGDDVVCRHFEHSWLKESWAVFVETVWLGETKSKEAEDYDLHVNARTYFEEANERYVRPIVTRTYNSSWDLFDAHLYPGGAWRLHMLRRLVGDAAFWAATTDYLATYSGRVVETDDFRRKLEEHSGLNLTRFFDQWLLAPGYPKLKATFKHDAEEGLGTLTVEQTQVDEKKGVGLFTFTLEIEVTDGGGTRTVPLEISEQRHTAVFKVEGQPTRILLDPASKVLFGVEFNPGDALLRAALREAPGVRSRIWAAAELIRTGTRANLASVAEAMRAEPFWGVRVAVAQELGGSGQAEAVGPLAELLLAEKDARVKRFWARACGQLRDTRLRDALRGFLAAEQPPWARAAACEALGLQRDEEDLDRLAKWVAFEDRHALTAAGALRGLGSLPSRRALEMLEAWLPYGRLPRAARPAAVEAYSRCARLLDREAKERALRALVDLTRDRDERVRLRAATDLAGLGFAGAIPALESMKALHHHEAGVRIDRAIARLRKGAAGEETTKLRAQVEKLEDRLRKLDERLQDLEARQSGT